MKNLKSELIETRNYKNLKDAYVPYPLKFAKRNGLNVTQTLLYAIIAQFSKFEHGAYTGSLQTLQVMLNISRYALQKNLKAVIERGFITEGKTKDGRTCYVASAPLEREIYVAYPLRFAVRFNLTRAQTVLYAIVAHYSRLKIKAFTGSVETLAGYLNVSKNSARDNINALIKRGFIIRYIDESLRVTYVDGLSHKPGQTEKELEANILYIKEHNNELSRTKEGRSPRKPKKVEVKSEVITPKNKRFGVHFANERTYDKSQLDKLIKHFENFDVD